VHERILGEGSLLRPNFIQPYRCQGVLIEGVKIVNSPMWEINPVLCRNVTVRGVEVVSHGPNNDGCDPESCTDVLIEDCLFDTGDDCIAIKSGRNRDGRRVAAACENLVIRKCVMKDGHGAVTIGSEISGNVRNVFAEDCRMESPNQDRILRIKTNSIRGGIIEHIYLRNLTATEVADAAIQVDFQYEEGDAGKFDPQVRDIQVKNLTCRKARYAIHLRGYERSPVRDVLVEDCVFENVAKPNVLENTANVVFRRTRINGNATLRV
jgi:polygalacturonase